MHRLLHRLEDHILRQAQQGADAAGLRRAEVGDMVDLAFVQTDGAHQIDVDFVTSGGAANEVRARFAHGLRHGEDRRDVVAGMRVISGEESVVHVQFAHRGAVRPCGPFRAEALIGGDTEHRCPASAGVAERHAARGGDRAAVNGGDGDGGVVDHPVDDHVRRVGRHRHRVRRDAGDLPGQLVFARQVHLGRVDFNLVQFHLGILRKKDSMNRDRKPANEPETRRASGALAATADGSSVAPATS